MICYPLLSQYSSSFDASKVAFSFRHDEQVLPGFLICSSAPAAIYLIHDHDRRPASGSLHQSAAAASAAAAAFASPAGRGRPGGTRGSRRHTRILDRGGQPGDCFQRSHLPPILPPGFGCRFPATNHRSSHLRGYRSHHHRCGAGLRPAGAASVHFGALSPSALQGQRPQGRPLSAPGAPGATPAYPLIFRRRAPLRASHQRHQVLLVTL